MVVRPAMDTDTWWHLRAGETISEEGEILKLDRFSSTRLGQTWEYPGWLAQVVLFKVFDGAGFIGLNLFTAGAVLAGLWLIWPLLNGPLLLRSFVMILSGAASAVFWSARPQILTFLLTAVFLNILEKWRKDKSRVIWLLPFLMALWINLHGGFAVGFLLLGLYLLAEVLEIIVQVFTESIRVRDLWISHRPNLTSLGICLFLCVLASGLNPSGFRMLAYPFQTVSIQTLALHILEWQPPALTNLQMLPFFILFILVLAGILFRWKHVPILEILILGVFSYLSFSAARNIALFALVAAPVLARRWNEIIEPLVGRYKKRGQISEKITLRLNLFIALILVPLMLLAVADGLRQDRNQEHIHSQVPVSALNYLETQPESGPIFNSYNWGGYLVWRLYPQYKSFVDGRTDLFGDELLAEYFQTWQGGPGWEQLFNRWGITTVLIEAQAPLVQVLLDAGWHLEYQDSQAVILLLDG
jgi:hypothetical protein